MSQFVPLFTHVLVINHNGTTTPVFFFASEEELENFFEGLQKDWQVGTYENAGVFQSPQTICEWLRPTGLRLYSWNYFNASQRVEKELDKTKWEEWFAKYDTIAGEHVRYLTRKIGKAQKRLEELIETGSV